MQVDLKKLKPLGIVLVLGCAVLAFITCLTVDMGIPERYESMHTPEYYRESVEHLEELTAELEENVFPGLEGVTGCSVDTETMTVAVVTDREYTDKVRAVLERDFGEGLITVAAQED